MRLVKRFLRKYTMGLRFRCSILLLSLYSLFHRSAFRSCVVAFNDVGFFRISQNTTLSIHAGACRILGI